MPILKFLIHSIIFLIPSVAIGQSTFTEHIQKQQAGEGKVIIVQDSKIDDVVNNVPKKSPSSQSNTELKESTQNNQHNEKEERYKNSTTSHYAGTRQRYQTTGYRIQIFTGNNSHKDKTMAYEIGKKCQKTFPMLSIYPRFINPRWTCRVGDFKTHEEANKYAQKIRSAKVSKEVRIVKCTVLLAH